MGKNEQKPAIRFQGFTDAWEQRKVGDYLTLSRILGHTGVDAKKLTVKLWAKGVVEKTDIYGGSENTQYYVRHTGQFMYGKLDFLHAAFGIVPESLNGYESTLDSPAFDLNGIDGSFLLNRVSQDDFYLKYGTIANGSRKAKRIHEDTFLAMPIAVPTIEEQKTIGHYFDNLDNLITLHQRKHENLTNIKKSMLEKMFPRDGASVPEIRFSGFTDAWEQRKLGEVIRLKGRIGFRGYTEKDIVSKDDGGVLTFSPTNIVDNKLTTNCKNTYITRFKYDESPEIKIHNGDILFVKTGSTLGKSALVTGLSEDATLNPQVVVMRTNNLNAEFLAAMLVTNTIISQVNSAKIGGAVPTLTEARIKDFDVAIPVSEAEKEQIGQFFSQLDNLITLHQRKLEKLKNIKKSMLEKMFV